jgi:hypothetical protein
MKIIHFGQKNKEEVITGNVSLRMCIILKLYYIFKCSGVKISRWPAFTAVQLSSEFGNDASVSRDFGQLCPDEQLFKRRVYVSSVETLFSTVLQE